MAEPTAFTKWIYTFIIAVLLLSVCQLHLRIHIIKLYEGTWRTWWIGRIIPWTTSTTTPHLRKSARWIYQYRNLIAQKCGKTTSSSWMANVVPKQCFQIEFHRSGVAFICEFFTPIYFVTDLYPIFRCIGLLLLFGQNIVPNVVRHVWWNDGGACEQCTVHGVMRIVCIAIIRITPHTQNTLETPQNYNLFNA